MTDKEKDEAVNGFIQLTAQHTLAFFKMLGLESHIEGKVIDTATGDEYIFIFQKT